MLTTTRRLDAGSAPASRRILLTPDAEGHISPQQGSDARFLASYFAEATVSGSEEFWLSDIWADAGVSKSVATMAMRLSYELAQSMQRELDGRAEQALMPLTLDIAINIVEQCAERMMRL